MSCPSSPTRSLSQQGGGRREESPLHEGTVGRSQCPCPFLSKPHTDPEPFPTRLSLDTTAAQLCPQAIAFSCVFTNQGPDGHHPVTLGRQGAQLASLPTWPCRLPGFTCKKPRKGWVSGREGAGAGRDGEPACGPVQLGSGRTSPPAMTYSPRGNRSLALTVPPARR